MALPANAAHLFVETCMRRFCLRQGHIDAFVNELDRCILQGEDAMCPSNLAHVPRMEDVFPLEPELSRTAKKLAEAKLKEWVADKRPLLNALMTMWFDKKDPLTKIREAGLATESKFLRDIIKRQREELQAAADELKGTRDAIGSVLRVTEKLAQHTSSTIKRRRIEDEESD